MPDQIFIGELEQILDRDNRTIRTWVRDAQRISKALGGQEPPDEYLQSDLWPSQEDSGRRRIFWWPDQIVGLKDFADDKSARRGWQASRS